MDELKEKLEFLEGENEELKETINDLEGKVFSLEEENDDLKTELDDVQGDLDYIREKYDKVKNKYADIYELIEKEYKYSPNPPELTIDGLLYFIKQNTND